MDAYFWPLIRYDSLEALVARWQIFIGAGIYRCRYLEVQVFIGADVYRCRYS